MIGSTADYDHQISSGVFISTFILFGYGLCADCLSTEGIWQQLLAAFAPISREPVGDRKDIWSSGDAAVP